MKAVMTQPTRTYMRAPAYPNAATLRQRFHRLVDTALVAASGAGIAAIILLLTALA